MCVCFSRFVFPSDSTNNNSCLLMTPKRSEGVLRYGVFIWKNKNGMYSFALTLLSLQAFRATPRPPRTHPYNPLSITRPQGQSLHAIFRLIISDLLHSSWHDGWWCGISYMCACVWLARGAVDNKDSARNSKGLLTRGKQKNE